MICRISKKHVADQTVHIPLSDAVRLYLGNDWSELIAEQTWPELDELLDGAPTISRATLRHRLTKLAADTAKERLDAIEEAWATDEEIFELALDDVDLDPEDLAALDTHLGERLLTDALEVYGEALACRITEAV